MGCDVTIILTTQTHSKIIIFEAKLPRLASSKAVWDYPQTSTGLSHFSDQLARQKSYTKSFAVFEMFYLDYPFKGQPRFMNDYLSACVWHDAATAFDSSRSSAPSPWSNSDLTGMLSAGHHHIGEILHDVCICKMGNQISMTGSGDRIADEFRLEGLILQIEVTEESTAETT